jgi:hypothetical protein
MDLYLLKKETDYTCNSNLYVIIVDLLLVCVHHRKCFNGGHDITVWNRQKFSPYAFVYVHSIRSNQYSMENYLKILFTPFYCEKNFESHFQNFFCVFLIISVFLLTFPYFPNFSTILNAGRSRLVSKWREWSARQLNRAEIFYFPLNVSLDSTVLRSTPYSLAMFYKIYLKKKL